MTTKQKIECIKRRLDKTFEQDSETGLAHKSNQLPIVGPSGKRQRKVTQAQLRFF